MNWYLSHCCFFRVGCLQQPIKHVERPGESHEGVGRKKKAPNVPQYGQPGQEPLEPATFGFAPQPLHQMLGRRIFFFPLVWPFSEVF